MIRTVARNLWCRMKALIVVVGALHVVLAGYYKNRKPYREVLLFPLYWEKLKRGRCFTAYNLKSTVDSMRIAHSRNIEADSKKRTGSSISTHIFAIIGIAWFGEKMNMNIRLSCLDLESVFDNFNLINSPKNLHKDRASHLKEIRLWENYAKFAVPAEFGYKIISKLAIKADFRAQADEWFSSKPQGDWVGIHYRGTDLKITGGGYRLISIESYIAYLKEVLDDRYNIFACSDQAQFIEQIKEAFPGRVFSTEIKRSYDSRPLHRREFYDKQRIEDALMDLLILSRTQLIYTTGSWFSEIVRFFNPSIKIVSFQLLWVRFKYHQKVDNFIPVPKASMLLKKRKRGKNQVPG